MKTIIRDLKDYNAEAKMYIDLFIAEGHDTVGVLEVSKRMVKLLEPFVARLQARQERINKINKIND